MCTHFKLLYEVILMTTHSMLSKKGINVLVEKKFLSRAMAASISSLCPTKKAVFLRMFRHENSALLFIYVVI